MSLFADLTAQLAASQDLSAAEVTAAAAALAAPGEPDEHKAAFLTALANKGETPDEIAGFALVFRNLAIDPGVSAWAPRALDVVGTGGDHAGGFNVSSLVVLVLAAALGVDLYAPPEKVRRALDQLGYAFFFAPNYHPAFKHVAPVRKALAAQGRRTVFNLLGPLINPGRPAHILLGVYALSMLDKLSRTLEALGQGAGLVGHGVITAEQGIDELTTATVNHVRGVGRLREVSAQWRAEDFGLVPSAFAEIQGGDLTANLALVEGMLAGKGPRGLVDTIVLNAAVGLHIVGRTTSIRDGIAPARDLLLGGAVAAKIAATREFYSS